MKSAFPTFVGSRALCEQVANAVLTERFSHAYILSGPEGFGKRTLARLVSAALSCEQKGVDGVPLPCGVCPSCRKILADTSPDVLRISKGDRVTLGVESVRFLREDVLIPPNDGDVKVYVIEDADTMTAQAQNALLLTLEEPPRYVVFFLLAKDPSALLETVRSRAPVLRIEPVSDAELREYLLRNAGKNADITDGIVSGAGGSIGKAMHLLCPDGQKPLMRHRTSASELVCAADASAYLAWVQSVGTKRDEVDAVLTLARDAVRDLLALRKCDNPPLSFYFSGNDAESICRGRSPSWLARLDAQLAFASERLAGNANLRLTLITLGIRAGFLSPGHI